MNVSWQKYPSSESKKYAGIPSKSKVGYCKCYALFVLYELFLTLFYKPIHQISNSASLISYALSRNVILSYLVLFKVVGHNTLCT